MTAAITGVPDPWLAELVGRIGYNVIWFDLEYRSFDAASAERFVLACRATGIDLMVRIRKTGDQEPMQALECGSKRILVPHCCSAAEARQWVEWCRLAPEGKRGMDGSGVDADYAPAPPREYMQHANRETFLALQVEDREAVEQIDEIAAVPGFYILFSLSDRPLDQPRCADADRSPGGAGDHRPRCRNSRAPRQIVDDSHCHSRGRAEDARPWRAHGNQRRRPLVLGSQIPL